jgi:hypothetical protein
MMADAGASGIATELTEMCVKLCADTVPNVRFNAAWAAGKLGAARLCDTEGLKTALTVSVDTHDLATRQLSWFLCDCPP